MTIEQMRRIKEEEGYTNEMIAKKSGVPLGTVQKIFAGVTKHPRFETMLALEDALCGFGLPVDEALGKLTFPYVETRSPLNSAAAPAPDADPAVSDQENAGEKGYRHELQKEKSAFCGVMEPAAEYWSSAAERFPRQGEYSLEDYYALPDSIRAELIDGEIFIMEAPTTIHQLIGSEIYGTLRAYIRNHHGDCLPFVAPVDVQLNCDKRNMLQPDVLVVCDRSKVIRRCVYGAPDFVAEILSPSSKKKDMILKLSKYGCAGVREYWIVDPDRKRVITYYFTNDEENGFDEEVAIYGFSDVIPVRIYNGDCTIDFREINEYIRFLYDKEE